MTKERFKKIKDFDYYISTHGRVWNARHQKFIKGYPHEYSGGTTVHQILLSKNGKGYCRSLHKLWRTTFNMPKGYIIPQPTAVGYSPYE